MRNILLIFIIAALPVYSQIRINEVCPSNYKSYYDEDMDTPDWIELYNEGDEAVNLKDWRISDRDDFENAWVLPDTVINPGEYIVVFASGKDTVVNNIKVTSNGINTITNNFDDNLSMAYLPLNGNNKITVKFNKFQFETDSTNVYANAGLILKDKLEPNSRMLTLLGRHRNHKSFLSYFRRTLHEYRGVNTFKGGYKWEKYYFSMEVKNDTIINSVMDEEYNLLEKQEYHYPDLDKYYVGLTVLSNNLNNFYDLNISEIYLNENKIGIEDFKTISFYDTEIEIKKERILHSNFELDKDKESVYLYNISKEIIDSINWEGLYSDVTVSEKYDQNFYINEPTPGKGNKSEYTKISKTPNISKELIIGSGKIEIPIADYENLYYTTNFEEPTINSKKLNKNITITGNKLLKIKRITDGEVPSKTVILPIIMADNIISNSYNVFLFSNEGAFFNTIDGVLVSEFSEKRAKGWLVVLDDNSILFNSEIEIRQSGVMSNTISPQKSMSLKFGNLNEVINLQSNIFSNKSEYFSDQIVLRNAGNDWHSAYIRDALSQYIGNNIEQLKDWADYQPLPVYINNDFWGVYNAREKINEDYFANKLNVNQNRINIFKNSLIVNEGSPSELINFQNKIKKLNDDYDTLYKKADSIIDINNLIDYLYFNVVIGNRDWPENNIKAYNIDGQTKWRYYNDDLDFSFGLDNVREDNNNLHLIFNNDITFTTALFYELMKNIEFRNRFLNRGSDLMNHQILPEKVMKKFEEITSKIRPLMHLQNQRWDEAFNDWEDQLTVIENYINNRYPVFRQHLVEHFEFSGTSELNLTTHPQSSGTFKVNTIDIDTSDWSGIYFQDVPVNITAKAKHGYKFKRWNYDSLPAEKTIEVYIPEVYNLEAIYEEHDPTEQDTFIVVNEIMYSAHEDNDSDDWIEIYNGGQSDIDLGGWYVIDNDTSHTPFIFPENTLLRRGEYLILAEDTTAFNEVYEYDELEILIGEFDFGFGEFDEVNLYTPDSSLHDYVDYGNEEPWPLGAYGTGYTIELINPSLDNNVGEHWEISSPTGGTPFAENSVFDSTFTNVEISNNGSINIQHRIDENNQLIINSDEVINSLKVYDLNGRYIDGKELNNLQHFATFDLSRLEKGFYFIHIITESNKAVIKILRDHR